MHDQSKDLAGITMFRLFNDLELPEFVKQAELDTQDELAQLPKEAFADDVRKEYPINSAARVYVSNAFFKNKQAELAKHYGKEYVAYVGARIKQAAELYKISEDLSKFEGTLNKQASATTEYIASFEAVDHFGELQVVDLFPIKTAEDLALSANVFADNISNYPMEWRRQIANSFVEKSAMYHVEELPDIVCKYAGLYFPADKETIKNELQRRGSKLQKEASKEAVKQMVDLVDDLETIPDYLKLAEAVGVIEQRDGVMDLPQASSFLPDPVDYIFSNSPEKVAALLDTVEMGGEVWKLADLKQIPADRYKEAFDIDIDPTDDTTLRDILPTMPLSDVALFRELSGINPI